MYSAQLRREQELYLLAQQGVPLRTSGKYGHWILGPLHLYTASGRWFNQETGARGRLKRRMLQVIEREYFHRWPPG